MFDFLFSDITVVSPGSEKPALNNAYVGVKNGKIAHVGGKPEEGANETINGSNKLIMPGLVNAHTHIPMTAFRGWGDGHDLQTWLFDYIFPYEDKLDGKAAAICSQMGLAEAIASGTVSIMDMYFLYGDVAPAIAASGLSANLSRACQAFSDDYDFNTCRRVSEARELASEWHGFDDGRIMVDASIHAEYTSNERLWRPMAEYAAENGLGMHVHISETKLEHEECIARNGKTPMKLFADMGLFKTRAAAAHCVWVSDEDIEIMREYGVSALHNPVSNLKLASGVFRARSVLNAGVNVALGTDGVSSNDNLDMFEEIKLAATLHRGVSLNPTQIGTLDALRMATCGGAAAMGRGDETGRIEEGMRADIIMLDMDKPHFYPRHDVLALLAYAARGSDVCLTMARGKILYRDGRHFTIDIEKTKYDLLNYVMPKVFG